MTITNRDPGDETPDDVHLIYVRDVSDSTNPREVTAVLAAARDVVEQAQPRDENSAVINAYWLDSLRAALVAAGVEMEE